MRIGAVMILRDEVDFVAVNIAYHRGMGVTDFYVTDNGSTDGTAEVLTALAADDPSIHLDIDPGRYQQDVRRTQLARRAAADGCDWIVPIDGDEFWWAEGGSLADVLADTDTHVGVMEAEMISFVQHRAVTKRSAAALLTMTRRTARQLGTVQDAQALVGAGEIAYVEMDHPVKCVSRTNPAIIVHPGAHDIDGVPGSQVETSRLHVMHASMRARDVLEKKAAHGRRLERDGLPPDISWHIRRWTRLADAGALEAEWAANSWRDEGTGVLDLPAGPRELVVDTSLADGVRPYLELPRETGLMGRLWRRAARAFAIGR